MTRAFLMAIAILCYFAFFASFVYLVGFVGNFPGLPITVDRGPEAPVAMAVVTDLALIALFGLQHSVMARKGFKAAWTRIVPAPIERSVYCLASALALAVMYLFWLPIPQVIWDVRGSGLGMALWAMFGAGWTILFISTWLLNHFELFGLAQAWRNFSGAAEPANDFKTPGFYRYVRHPIYTGFFLAFWAAPMMSLGHLVLAGGMTAYILIGISFEERDLIARFGNRYAEYRTKVGMLIPGLGKQR
jgi:protein-S-isoprenylcysteine O-methyltransferase Ste14